MTVERILGGTCAHPFPVCPQLTETLAAAHLTGAVEPDAQVAHVLGTCAGYAYADTDTVATMMTRLGLERHACVRITQTVDAMFIFSTVYLVQSLCGRVVILSYRGTEPGTLGNWLGDAEVGLESNTLSLADGVERIRVHAGFHRNVRATWLPVLDELAAALQGWSLVDHNMHVEHSLEALYVTGHRSSVDEMIRSTERGLLVTRFWYIREVDPYQKILTGMTRDGTFWIENGQVKHGVRNLRFNQSLLDMLCQVEMMSPPQRTAGEESFEMVVPAAKIREFNFASTTKY